MINNKPKNKVFNHNNKKKSKLNKLSKIKIKMLKRYN